MDDFSTISDALAKINKNKEEAKKIKAQTSFLKEILRALKGE